MNSFRATARRSVLAGIVLLAFGLPAFAQQGPSTGPTNPIPPNPMSKDGATMVINPTKAECQRGWQPGMRWTAEQFAEFCNKLGASK